MRDSEISGAVTILADNVLAAQVWEQLQASGVDTTSLRPARRSGRGRRSRQRGRGSVAGGLSRRRGSVRPDEDGAV